MSCILLKIFEKQHVIKLCHTRNHCWLMVVPAQKKQARRIKVITGDSRVKSLRLGLYYLCVRVNLSYGGNFSFQRVIEWCLSNKWACLCQTIGYLELKGYHSYGRERGHLEDLWYACKM